jgi:hypothetical protein
MERIVADLDVVDKRTALAGGHDGAMPRCV